MTVKDPFSYSAGWDSIGLDCSNCIHFHSPKEWPDKDKVSSCDLHQISLSIELGENCYKNWEWFCKDFQNKNAFPKALEEFQQIKEKLEAQVLYRGYGEDGLLLKFKFESLPNGT